jgi:hypothetical protein
MRQHRTRNLEIPGLVLTHHPGMTKRRWIASLSLAMMISEMGGFIYPGTVSNTSCETSALVSTLQIASINGVAS